MAKNYKEKLEVVEKQNKLEQDKIKDENSLKMEEVVDAFKQQL